MSTVDVDQDVDKKVEVADQPSSLEMSDEDFLKLGPPADVVKPEVKVETTVVAEVVTDVVDATKTNVADDADDIAAEAGASPADKAVADAAKVVVKEPKDDKATKPAVDGAPADKKVEPEVKVEAVVIDYKAEYERLIAPFKANGREIKVDSVDDAQALMQMGANYNKKMAALKPNLKIMKMLENNGFLSEEKIGFLIDLGKKDPAAINKLVQDAGIDPMDLDAEKGKAYKQTTYAVDDREIELDTVLDELQGSKAYTQLLDVVSNKWDVASKQVVSKSPQLLKVISGHIESGIYDLISTEVEKQRVFGRLNGLSDIEAYRQIGDSIQARGGFNHLAPSQGQSKPKQGEVVTPKPKPAEEVDKLNDKRRAASSTKPAPASATAKDFNPLSMSDEEFGKLAAPKYS